MMRLRGHYDEAAGSCAGTPDVSDGPFHRQCREQGGICETTGLSNLVVKRLRVMIGVNRTMEMVDQLAYQVVYTLTISD